MISKAKGTKAKEKQQTKSRPPCVNGCHNGMKGIEKKTKITKIYK